MDAVHDTSSNFLTSHINFSFPSTPRSSKWASSFRSPPPTKYCSISPLPFACQANVLYAGLKSERNTKPIKLTVIIIIIIIIIVIGSIVPSRNIGCLWVLSTSVYRLLRTLVHSSFYPLPWLPIFSSYFSIFLSSFFPEGSTVGQPLVSFHPLYLMCDRSI